MSTYPSLFVIDDDADWLLELQGVACALGINFKSFASTAEFLEQADAPGCVLVDVGLAKNWLTLRDALRERGRSNPLVLMAATVDVRMIVEAMRNGAESVIVKPCEPDCLRQAIEEALASDADGRKHRTLHADVQRRFESLTPQEREVMWQIVDGSPNKVTARRIGVSVRTIENRRRSIFAKLGIRSVAELVATVLQSAPRRMDAPWQESWARGDQSTMGELATCATTD